MRLRIIHELFKRGLLLRDRYYTNKDGKFSKRKSMGFPQDR